MTHTNPITTPVLDLTPDTTTNPSVDDTLPILTFAPETMIHLHGERNAANNGGGAAVHEPDELRSVILNNLGMPGIRLRANDDLRGRISTSRQAIMNELSERVFDDLPKRPPRLRLRNRDRTQIDTFPRNAGNVNRNNANDTEATRDSDECTCRLKRSPG